MTSYISSGNGFSSLGTLTLWKITESGLKKVKTLKNAGRTYGFIGNELYYTVYKDKTKRELTLYSCKRNGTGQKKIAKIKDPEENRLVTVERIGPDSCGVFFWSDEDSSIFDYLYTYATKTLQETQ